MLTSGIYASIEAETAGDGKTDVGATLFVGEPIGLNFVELSSGDSLVAAAAGQTKPMVERKVLNTVVHHATFDLDAPGTAFEVRFQRGLDAGAPRSTATLPAAFAITSSPQSASRGAPVTLTWSPAGSGDAMSWRVSGECIEDEASPIDGDPGTVTIGAGTLDKRMGATIPDQCAVTFTIRRSKTGTLDPAYKGGAIIGTQFRTVTVSSTP